MQAGVEILVLDDESIVCERLKDYLENHGYRVETFEDSQQAIDRLRQKCFDVVITDLKMKGPTGLDIVHFIRQQDQHTQMIIITGYATMEAARDAEYCEVVDFIHKPFQLDRVGAAVKKAVKNAVKLKKRVDQPLPTKTEIKAKGGVEILVLDDESIVCERLKDYLENHGYLVETFGDSQQAIVRLRQKCFDVVITDLKMKGPTGLDIVHFIRQQDQHTQMIIITGYATMEAARDAEYCEVVDFVHKPFQLDQLGAAVKKAAKKAVRLRKQVDQ